MEGGVAASSPLDYAEFQIFPSQNRYEAYFCSGNKVEMLASGILKHLSLHLPDVKNLHSEGSKANFKFWAPAELNVAKWFTKSTLKRFLHIIGSPDSLDISTSIAKELSQLEEARKFHLTLYTKDNQNDHGSMGTDSSGFNGMASKPNQDEVDTVYSDSTKNELLRAMELRLTALRSDLADAFNRASGTSCSIEEIKNLQSLSYHLGAIDLRNFLCRFLEMQPENHSVDSSFDNKSLSLKVSLNEKLSNIEGSNQISRPIQSDTPVKYGVSPAKVAQFERQSSTESEESSCSCEEDHPTVERSRNLIRSASPRRSASPMRRIQIGRSGLRRTPALTIKSLNYFPGRDKTCLRDPSGESDEEEIPEQQPSRKPESHARRMSVQDTINLFESKQRGQNVDTQKTRSLLSASVIEHKAVLRRWSAGMGENVAQHDPDVSERSPTMVSNELGDGETPKTLPEVRTESESISGRQSPVLIADDGIKSDSTENKASIVEGVDASGNLTEEYSEKLTASVEWNRQREAELNQLMMKMMGSTPVSNQDAGADNEKNQNVPTEQRGGFYNHYKVKRDEKLRGETARKRVEKAAPVKAMQVVLDERKAVTVSGNTVDANKRHSMNKPQKSHRNLSQPANLKKETSKPATVKKPFCKAQSLPPTRKSWPSTPLPRAAGMPQAKTPTGLGTASTGLTPTRRKAQPAPAVSRSSPKVERSQARSSTVKVNPNDAKNDKLLSEKKAQTTPKNVKTAKSKILTSDHSSVEKPSLRSKTTKKSSVVPLETKSFLRKGSGTPSANIKTKVSSPPEEPLHKSADIYHVEETDVIAKASDQIVQQDNNAAAAPKLHADIESETQINRSQNCEDTISSNHGTNKNNKDSSKEMTDAGFTTEVEKESTISPSAWVEEIEEHQEQPIPHDDITCQTASSPGNAAPAEISSPRVRHSLSQMLLEESSEPDVIEWGNAENPPAMVYQKDAPKGLKRLLKFARKSKADVNLAGWSSPSAFSEGEEDTEESRVFGKKNADNLLRKAALNAKNYGQQKISLASEAHSKNYVARELSVQSSNSKGSVANSYKLQESNLSATASSTKATRAFFSLSAFRGSKPNDSKFR